MDLGKNKYLKVGEDYAEDLQIENGQIKER